MSGRNCTEVEVTVRSKGDTYLARAGQGRDAESASSTSCAYGAAQRAAEKFFGCHLRRIVVGLENDNGDWIFRATKHAKPVKTIVVEFVDQGQDFLRWEIVVDNGQIINCTPFQYSVWCKWRVIDAARLVAGQHPRIERNGERLTLNYAVATITRKGGAK